MLGKSSHLHTLVLYVLAIERSNTSNRSLYLTSEILIGFS